MKLREELIVHPDCTIGEWSNGKDIVDTINQYLPLKDWVNIHTRLIEIHTKLSNSVLDEIKINEILDIEFGYHSAKFNRHRAKFSIWLFIIAGAVYLYIFTTEDERSIVASTLGLLLQLLGK